MCLLILVGIYFSMTAIYRLQGIVVDIQSGVDNELFSTLREIMDESPPDEDLQSYWEIIKNTIFDMVARSVGLKKMPSEVHLKQALKYLIEQAGKLSLVEIKKSMYLCGHAVPPDVHDFSDTFYGKFAYGIANTMIQATNAVTGETVLHCAVSTMTFRISSNLLKAWSIYTIQVEQMQTRITSVKSLLTWALYILTFSVPNAIRIISDVTGSRHDSALVDYRKEL